MKDSLLILQVCNLDVVLWFEPQEVLKAMKNQFIKIRSSAIKFAGTKKKQTFGGNDFQKYNSQLSRQTMGWTTKDFVTERPK